MARKRCSLTANAASAWLRSAISARSAVVRSCTRSSMRRSRPVRASNSALSIAAPATAGSASSQTAVNRRLSAVGGSLISRSSRCSPTLTRPIWLRTAAPGASFSQPGGPANRCLAALRWAALSALPSRLLSVRQARKLRSSLLGRAEASNWPASTTAKTNWWRDAPGAGAGTDISISNAGLPGVRSAALLPTTTAGLAAPMAPAAAGAAVPVKPVTVTTASLARALSAARRRAGAISTRPSGVSCAPGSVTGVFGAACRWRSCQSGGAPGAGAAVGAAAPTAVPAAGPCASQATLRRPGTRAVQPLAKALNTPGGRPSPPAAITPRSATAASTGSVSSWLMRRRRAVASRSKAPCRRCSSRRATWLKPGSITSTSSTSGKATGRRRGRHGACGWASQHSSTGAVTTMPAVSAMNLPTAPASCGGASGRAAAASTPHCASMVESTPTAAAAGAANSTKRRKRAAVSSCSRSGSGAWRISQPAVIACRPSTPASTNATCPPLPLARSPSATPASAAGTVQRPRDIAAATATPNTTDSGARATAPSV